MHLAPFEPAVGDHARVRAALAPMLAEPRISATQTSQLAGGRTATIAERRGDWVLALAEDGYEGWMHVGYLEAARGDECDWPLSTSCVVRETDGRERALPFGARVSPDAMLLSGEAYDDDERARTFRPEIEPVAASAETRFVGTGYLWGGTTNWGVDCSGFVQAVLRLHDIALPRDAWQQAQCGDGLAVHALDDAGLALLQPADLVFFSDRDDGRVTHVVVALAGDRFVHSALGRGGVTVESWRAADDYVRRLRDRFVSARRVVGVRLS